ncbi:MAG: hypothetical protein JXA50_06160 [Deltaproteobacteria bacterium]|nr:hypothetical protein [Deltaproteobacteria bacterium]
MMQAQEKVAIDKGIQTLWVIWAAMLGSLVIYIFVYHLLGEGFNSGEEAVIPLGLLRKICAVLAAGALLTGYYLRRFMLKGRSEAARPATIRRAAALNQPPFVTQYTSLVIVSLACAESVGLYGLLLFLLGDSLQVFYTFIGISALAMVFYRPKKEEMEKIALAYKKEVGEESH